MDAIRECANLECLRQALLHSFIPARQATKSPLVFRPRGFCFQTLPEALRCPRKLLWRLPGRQGYVCQWWDLSVRKPCMSHPLLILGFVVIPLALFDSCRVFFVWHSAHNPTVLLGSSVPPSNWVTWSLSAAGQIFQLPYEIIRSICFSDEPGSQANRARQAALRSLQVRGPVSRSRESLRPGRRSSECSCTNCRYLALPPTH